MGKKPYPRGYRVPTEYEIEKHPRPKNPPLRRLQGSVPDSSGGASLSVVWERPVNKAYQQVIDSHKMSNPPKQKKSPRSNKK